MTTVRRTAACITFALAGCQTAPSTFHLPPALQRYELAASFLLPGHRSLALYSLPLEPDEGAPAAPPDTLLVACCGSDFEAPRGEGYGRFRGIEVFDFGTA